MGKFKVGDRVKFLSSTGGGIIRSFSATNVANVEMEDGFEVPTLVNDLVLDACEDKAGAFFCSKPQENEKDNTEQKEHTTEERSQASYLGHKAKEMAAGVYLCFVPHDQKWLVYGDMDVWMVNNTDHRCIYSILLLEERNGFVSEDYGTLEARQKQTICTITRDECDKWTKGAVQILFHDDMSDCVMMPVNCRLKIRTDKFYKEGCFVPTAFFQEKVLTIPICDEQEMNVFLRATTSETKDKDEEEEKQVLKVARQNYTNTFLDAYMTDSSCAEVDLHIGELVEDYYLLEPEQMLRIQLNHAERCLNEAIIQGLKKVIFIHGIGQGVLKNELKKMLDKYDNLHYFDASIMKYGAGATEVYLGKR